MKAAASILINKPVATTFRAFSDIANRKRYLSNITKLDVNSLLIEGKGVKWHEERVVNDTKIKGDLEIVSYRKPRALVFNTKSEGLEFKTRYNFQYAGENSTKVVVTIGGKPKGILARFLDSFLVKNTDYVSRQLMNELESFKSVIESD